MTSGEADAGVFGSIAGSDAFLHKQAVPVARPEKGGVSTYRGYLIARKKSGAKRVEDLRGKTFDSNGGSASVGRFFPEKLLRDRKTDLSTFFSEVTTSPKHEAVVSKVLNGDADCGTVKDSVFDKMAASDPRVKDEIVILATSQKFPDGNVMLRKGAAAGFVDAIRVALLGMASDKEARPALDAIGADRFIPSSAKEFELLGRAVHALEKK
jgi:phosphate/phosphite/phosphonate ABC transporter binding protein